MIQKAAFIHRCGFLRRRAWGKITLKNTIRGCGSFVTVARFLGWNSRFDSQISAASISFSQPGLVRSYTFNFHPEAAGHFGRRKMSCGLFNCQSPHKERAFERFFVLLGRRPRSDQEAHAPISIQNSLSRCRYRLDRRLDRTVGCWDMVVDRQTLMDVRPNPLSPKKKREHNHAWRQR